jgi:hypothetical protein
MKMLLKRNVRRNNYNQSILCDNKNLNVVAVFYEWDVFGNRTIVFTLQRQPNIIVRTILRIFIGSKWRLIGGKKI